MHWLIGNGGPFSAYVYVIISTIFSSLIGFRLARLVAPQLSPKSPNDLGRLWAAHWIYFCSIFELTQFFNGFNSLDFWQWLLIVCAGAPVSFLVGRSYGKRRGLSAESDVLGSSSKLDERTTDKNGFVLDHAVGQASYSTAIYKAFIGNKETNYYLNAFDRLSHLEPRIRSAPKIFFALPGANNSLVVASRTII